ncbi:MAG: HNH endonuclease [Thermoleophilaceae bacterium]|nr:HNH endonuclease [Thermoleophilaceae bacterium]
MLRRDGYACVRCRCRDGLEAHHVRLRARGGRDEPGNLETLCGPCHRGVHRAGSSGSGR